MRAWILALLGTVAVAAAQHDTAAADEPAAHSQPDQPNFIVVVLDEWGYHEMSGRGHPELRTPNLDRLAEGGMQFTQFLAGAPLCAPTRATLMLGRHAGHTSLRTNGGREAIRADDVTVATLLHDGGYATAGFGKWGLGGRGTTGVPERHGFDTFYGYYDQVHAHTYYPAYVIHNGEEVPQPGNDNDFYEGESHAQVVLFDAAMRWLREERPKDRPFFLYLPFTVPHGLWGFPEDDPAWAEFGDRPWRAGQRRETDSRVYAAMLRMVDRQLGELVAWLEEQGLGEDTLLWVSGDNGGQDYFRTPERPRGFFAPNVDPRTGIAFRGQKGTLYEGGLRIPAMVSWPGVVLPGRSSDHLGYFPDMLPTLCELAGVAVPDGIDGISFAATLRGVDGQAQHGFLYWELGGARAVRTGRWKAVRPRADRAWELYDLDVDVSEADDIAAEHPRVLELLRAMAREAHRPIRRGETLDPGPGDADHRQAPHRR